MDMIEWKPFIMGEIFDIRDGYYNKKPPEKPNGNFPFLGATQSGNSITMFCNLEDVLIQDKTGEITPPTKEGKIFPGNCITITNNGSVGFAYYQVHPFTCSHDVNPVYINNRKITKELAMFLIPIFEQAGKNFQYARKWRPKRMRKTRILLPVNKDGCPDWDYMERFISTVKKNKNLKTKLFLEKELNKIGEFNEVSLDSTNWDQFKIDTVFNTLQRGKRLTKANQTDGYVPYISSTSLRNGIDSFIDEKLSADNRTFDLGITLANSGSVGKAFYQDYRFVGSDHITTLWNEHINEYSALFIVTCLEQIGEKYSFNREMNNHRLSNDIIHLPINSHGKIDYLFMENYIKGLKAKKIKEVLNFFELK